MEEKVILMLEQYISVITGVKDIEVEIIDETIVLSREGLWHCYIIPERFTVIGCLVDSDIDITNMLRKEAHNIWHIYEQVVKSETL